MIQKKLAKTRSKLLQTLRDFFKKNKFIEVETPIMNRIPGMEPHLTPFETSLTIPSNIKSTKKTIPLYLNTSPELQMKKLLGQGFGNIFQITKTFRNIEIGGPLHQPEFTMLEWYRKKADYFDIMKDCEKLILKLVKISNKRKKIITYQGKKIDLTLPWSRISVNKLFKKYVKIDLLKNKTFSSFKKTAIQKNLDIKACKDWDDIFFKIFLNNIEPHLGFPKPTFVYDYPSTQAALAKKNSKNPFFAERFELYIAGIELCNAFSELIDSKEQKTRLKQEQALRKLLKKTVFDIDEEFLSALESIYHPCAGNALGIDRLFMILLNKKDIKDVLLFPLIIDN